MKRCSYCGKECADTEAACPIDGEPLTVVAPQPLVLERAHSRPESIPAQLEEKRSGLGMASFCISIAVGCLMIALFTVANILNSGRIQHGHGYPGQAIVGLIAIALLAADAVAVGLGVAALCQSGRKTLFGILGLVFSSATIVGTIGLIILGLSYAGRFTK